MLNQALASDNQNRYLPKKSPIKQKTNRQILLKDKSLHNQQPLGCN